MPASSVGSVCVTSVDAADYARNPAYHGDVFARDVVTMGAAALETVVTRAAKKESLSEIYEAGVLFRNARQDECTMNNSVDVN